MPTPCPSAFTYAGRYIMARPPRGRVHAPKQAALSQLCVPTESAVPEGASLWDKRHSRRPRLLLPPPPQASAPSKLFQAERSHRQSPRKSKSHKGAPTTIGLFWGAQRGSFSNAGRADFTDSGSAHLNLYAADDKRHARQKVARSGAAPVCMESSTRHLRPRVN